MQFYVGKTSTVRQRKKHGDSPYSQALASTCKRSHVSIYIHRDIKLEIERDVDGEERKETDKEEM